MVSPPMVRAEKRVDASASKRVDHEKTKRQT